MLNTSLRLTASFSLITTLILSSCSLAFADSIAVPDPPQLAAKAWVLVDFDSGRVLAEHNANEQVEPASLTKIMTGYIVFRELAANRLKMDELATISKNAWQQPGSRSFVNVGAQLPIDTLVHGMIIQSGNDSSVALAEKVAGSVEVFSQQMNEHAQKLGMTGTHFVNPTGLPDPAHYTTANDMVKVASAVIRNFPEYYKIYSQKEFVWNNIKQANRNRLLWQDESVDGMKTGHTESAGYCLVASAKRGDMRLISVILGTDSEKARAQESQKLLNYGFRFYETHKLYQANQELQKIHVWQGEKDDLAIGTADATYLTIPRGQYDNLKPVIEFQSEMIAPVSKGQTIGTLKVTLADKELAKIPLIALEDVAQGGFFKRAIDQAKLAIERMISNK
jgi:D-alanyl-D-alanine carboxypeptidase (penicillin-binding protein 5/6)